MKGFREKFMSSLVSAHFLSVSTALSCLPQMSNVPFLLASFSMFSFFVLWVLNSWFNLSFGSSAGKTSADSHKISFSWPLN